MLTKLVQAVWERSRSVDGEAKHVLCNVGLLAEVLAEMLAEVLWGYRVSNCYPLMEEASAGRLLFGATCGSYLV